MSPAALESGAPITLKLVKFTNVTILVSGWLRVQGKSSPWLIGAGGLRTASEQRAAGICRDPTR